MAKLKFLIVLALISVGKAEDVFRKNAVTASGNKCMNDCKKSQNGIDDWCRTGWEREELEICKNETSNALVYFTAIYVQGSRQCASLVWFY